LIHDLDRGFNQNAALKFSRFPLVHFHAQFANLLSLVNCMKSVVAVPLDALE